MVTKTKENQLLQHLKKRYLNRRYHIKENIWFDVSRMAVNAHGDIQVLIEEHQMTIANEHLEKLIAVASEMRTYYTTHIFFHFDEEKYKEGL
jgi:hypothetical protein